MNTINNKNLIVGAASLIIILLLAFVSYSFVKTKNPFNKKGQETTSLSELDKKTSDELRKEQIISEKKDEITKEDCAVAELKIKDDCLSLAAINEAVANSDLKICEGLKNKWGDICIWRLAQALTAQGLSEAENCSKIQDDATKDNCYLVAAVNLNQEKICNNCQYSKEECLDKVKERNSNQLSDCINIKSDGIYRACLKNKKEDCGSLNDKDATNRCQSWQMYDNIIPGGKKEDCAKFPLDKFKKVCEIYFDQGYIDSDEDGANNYEELLLGTDPFVLDKNATGLKYDSIRRQILIGSYYQMLDNLFSVMSNIKDKKLSTSTDTEIK